MTLCDVGCAGGVGDGVGGGCICGVAGSYNICGECRVCCVIYVDPISCVGIRIYAGVVLWLWLLLVVLVVLMVLTVLVV